MRIFYLIIFCLITSAVAEETVYKQVDEQGNIVFSDDDVPGAEVITVEDPQTIPAFRQSAPAWSQKELTKREYSVKVATPTHDQTFIDNTGTIDVSVSVSPQLRSDHRLQVSMDGGVVSSKGQFALSNVERGSHTLMATVFDQAGKQMASSEPVTFHLKRHFIKPKPAPKK